jgi:D-alanyl-D-alanine carboxypeptidase
MTATSTPQVTAHGTAEAHGKAEQFRRRYTRGSVWAVLVLVLVSAGCGSTSPTSTPGTGATPEPSPTKALDASTTAQLQTALDDARAQGGFPGVIAAVWTPNGTWTGASGTTGQGQNAVPTATDHTRIGSLTKTVTATVLLQLYESGQVTLEDPIGKYVSGIPNGDTATLRQLANMTSGIPSYTADDAFQKQLFTDPTKAWTPEQLVDVVRGKPADFAPGSSWEYSNTNYVLLGMVIEKVTGKPAAEVFQERIFGPLGMTQTSFPAQSNAIADPHLFGITAQGQSSGQTTDATNWNPSVAFTAGAIISNLDDLHTWSEALFTGNGILKPETQQLRRDSIIHNIPPNTPTMGFGIGIGDRDGWWGFDGDIPGYTSSLYHNYDRQTTIIVAVNSDIPLPGTTPPALPAPAVFAALVKALQ